MDRQQPMRTLFVLLTAIASIHLALGTHEHRHLAGSGIRRLRRLSPQGAASLMLTSVMVTSAKPEKPCLLFIGIPSASQVIPYGHSSLASPQLDPYSRETGSLARSYAQLTPYRAQ